MVVGANMTRVQSQTFDLESEYSIFQLEGGFGLLAKAVLGSLPTYFMSIFKAPVQVINRLEGIRRRFLWGGNEEKHKILWIKWEDVVAPKALGGLGLGSIRNSNGAAIWKWDWRRSIGSGIGLHEWQNLTNQ